MLFLFHPNDVFLSHSQDLPEEIKRFYYGTDFFSELTNSSGIARVANPEPAISFYETASLQLKSINSYLTSSTLQNLYDSQGNAIVYNKVTEGIGNNFEGGAIVHTFNYSVEHPAKCYNEMIIGMPFTNVFGSGEELNTIYYKYINNTFVRVKEIVNSYVDDGRLSSSINGFRATLRVFNEVGTVKTFNLNTYQVNSMWHHLSSTSETIYDDAGANGCTVTTNYSFGNQLHLQPTGITKIILNPGSSTQRSLSTSFQYPQDYTFGGTVSGTADVLKTMITKNMVAIPIEQKTSSTTGNITSITSAELTTFKMNGAYVVRDKDYRLKSTNNGLNQDIVAFTNSSINSSGVFVYDSHYEQLNSYNRYDAYNNLLEYTDRQSTKSLIRDPNNGNLLAKIDNSTYGNVAYTNFEQSTNTFTNWNYNPSQATTSSYQGGTKGFRLGANLIATLLPLNAFQKYKVSLWRKVGAGSILIINAGSTKLTPRIGPQRNGWEYVEATFTGVTGLNINGVGIIDELRLYPINSRTTSYVYKDGVGISSECNENNQITFYEYDEFNRLKLTRDQDNNILKKDEYQYQVQY